MSVPSALGRSVQSRVTAAAHASAGDVRLFTARSGSPRLVAARADDRGLLIALAGAIVTFAAGRVTGSRYPSPASRPTGRRGHDLHAQPAALAAIGRPAAGRAVAPLGEQPQPGARPAGSSSGGEALLGAAVAANVMVIGVSLGAYGTRMAHAALPHGPVELAAYSLALALYLQGRRRPLARPPSPRSPRCRIALLAVAAVLETFVNV